MRYNRYMTTHEISLEKVEVCKIHNEEFREFEKVGWDGVNEVSYLSKKITCCFSCCYRQNENGGWFEEIEGSYFETPKYDEGTQEEMRLCEEKLLSKLGLGR